MTLPNRLSSMVVVTFLMFGAAVLAVPPKKMSVDEVSDALKSGDQTAAAATIDKIMEQAVANIARRYNLNDVQTQETDMLMKREVYKFLREHESEVWPAIRDLFAAGLGTTPPNSKEEIKRIGKAARPLTKLAKQAIYAANEEWRLILTEEQKKVHDFDLAEMKTTFDIIDENFGAWESGEAPGGPIFPAPNLKGRQPARPSKPQRGTLPKPQVEVFDPSNVFEELAQQFIKEYQLDDGQITSARSIVEEFKQKASDFRDAQKLEFAKIDLRVRRAYLARDAAAVKVAHADRKKLLDPIYGLCGTMEDRLKGLLTTAQIQRHEERRAARTPSRDGASAAKGKPSTAASERPRGSERAHSNEDADNG